MLREHLFLIAALPFASACIFIYSEDDGGQGGTPLGGDGGGASIASTGPAGVGGAGAMGGGGSEGTGGEPPCTQPPPIESETFVDHEASEFVTHALATTSTHVYVTGAGGMPQVLQYNKADARAFVAADGILSGIAVKMVAHDEGNVFLAPHRDHALYRCDFTLAPPMCAEKNEVLNGFNGLALLDGTSLAALRINPPSVLRLDFDGIESPDRDFPLVTDDLGERGFKGFDVATTSEGERTTVWSLLNDDGVQAVVLRSSPGGQLAHLTRTAGGVDIASDGTAVFTASEGVTEPMPQLWRWAEDAVPVAFVDGAYFPTEPTSPVAIDDSRGFVYAATPNGSGASLMRCSCGGCELDDFVCTALFTIDVDEDGSVFFGCDEGVRVVPAPDP